MEHARKELFFALHDGADGNTDRAMSDKDGRRILVLDGDQPAALSIVRSLASRGMTIDAGERAAKFLSSHSRHVRDALVYPDPLGDPEAFVDTIAERLARTHYDLVIPVAEDTLQPLAAQRERIERLAPLAIAPNAALELFTDKARTFELAEKLGVPVPASHTYTNAAELAAVAQTQRYPVVLKPARSIGKGKKRTKVNVVYAHDQEQFLSLARGLIKFGEVIVQEYFRGTGVGVELLADHGEVVYSFQHKRLHELPLTGGGSCLRESVPVHPKLLEYSRALMRETGWHGVAMVEFKLDEATDECRLMEVNPRFWGSLPLAVAAGADFPYYLVELITRGKKPLDAPPAKVGVLARKLSADVYWYVQVLKPDQDEPLIRWPTRQEAFRDLLLTFKPQHHFDVQSFSDPTPGLIDAAKTGAWVLERATAIARQKWARARARKTRSGGAALRRLEGAKQVIFICYGNINRSALADHHLRSILSQRPGMPAVKSAGFHEEVNRPADPSMVRVAKEHGLDLSRSRSRLLNRTMVEEADLIFAMEMKHLDRIFAAFPEAKSKTYLLSAVTTDVEIPLEIADPYGQAPADYAACYDQVTACTTAIGAALGVGAKEKLG
jgi:predicted ATP-grasp superfamily ATP-dependent carboligase/protein-tyrosine-phosphatase